jgi:hypothetical protein
MGGWRTFKTPIAEGQQIHYNFVKPHLALGNQTPAQVAGIRVEDENKRMELFKIAIAFS